jgi:hypothetical protein
MIKLQGAAPTFGIRASFIEVGIFIIVELRKSDGEMCVAR